MSNDKKIQEIDIMEGTTHEIANNQIIRFVFPNNNWIEIKFIKDENGISINGKKVIQVEPRASNLIHIRSEEFGG